MSDYVDPTTYDVIPRQWKVIDLPKVGEVVAAMMPYPGRMLEDRACTGDDRFTDDNAFNSSVQRQQMSEVCYSCKVQTACREYAIAHEDYGLWAATTPSDRRYVRRRRRQVLVEPHMAHVYGLNDDMLSFLFGNMPEPEGEWGAED
jgi:hypothetical protein